MMVDPQTPQKVYRTGADDDSLGKNEEKMTIEKLLMDDN